MASLALAFLARDVARDLLITPLAYLAWQAGIFYGAVPQLVKWVVVVLLLCVVVIWQLIPDFGPTQNRRPPLTQARGQVETLALWMYRARGSNYFRWQLANRLGHVARRTR